MAENETPTKVVDEKDEATSAEAEDLLSLDSLDSILADEDPEFARSLNEIGPDENIEIYNEGLQLEYTLAYEENLWKGSSGIRKKLATVFPFLPKIAFKIKVKRTETRLKWMKWKTHAIQNAKKAIPTFIAWTKNKVKEGAHAFAEFSKLKKLTFAGLLLLTGLGFFVVYKTITRGFIPQPEDLFIKSMSDWTQHEYQYNPESEMESFYESPRIAQNILLMKKMVVNLGRSANSNENPMGVFEFLVEGTANEVMLEIKDREPEVQDLFLRTIEEMTYDQVSSGEGKRVLCETLRKNLNKVLTKGYVRKVFIKTAIVKP
ncbi:MAG: flagellar basal body-associated FliL family protein [Bdellovibrio sp.]